MYSGNDDIFTANIRIIISNFFSPLTTVIESIFLFNVDIIALKVIGVDTNNIFFTTFFRLSCLWFTEFLISIAIFLL